jgi:hypothetical protein
LVEDGPAKFDMVRESGRGVVCAIEGLSECGFKDREVEGEWLEDDAPEKGGLEDWEWVWEWTWEVVDIASRDVVGRSRLPFDGPDVMLRVELAKHYLPSMLARDRQGGIDLRVEFAVGRQMGNNPGASSMQSNARHGYFT